jgi:excisionase family DNA binding protein
MNKEEVANYLGVSVRAVERYTKDGKLTVAAYEKQSRGGQKAIYDQVQVELLKIEMSQPKAMEMKEKQSDSSLVGVVSEKDKNLLIAQTDRFMGIFERIESKLNNQTSLGDKLTLSLAEAAQLAGLSKGYLKKAIDGGELKAAKRGKGWNIKRSDLEEWVKGL